MSRRRHKGGHEEEHENHERWLITYADMITLLMAFFVMMYGMSILDLKKFADFKAGAAKQLGKSPVIEGGQGILFGGTGIAEAASAPITGSGPRNGAEDAGQATGDVTRQDIGKLVTEVRRRLADNGLAGTVEAEVDPRGAVLRLPATVVFESGSASVSQEGLDVLDQIALVLRHVDNQVVIEGHTDDLPTNGRGFATNWELSTARATEVLRWLLDGRKLPAPRFSAAGYADTHPRFANDTPEHRALNRRVEIIVVAADSDLAPLTDALSAATTTTTTAPSTHTTATTATSSTATSTTAAKR